MTVIKRDRNASKQTLIDELEKFCDLLMGQSEDEAVADLKKASEMLQKNEAGSPQIKEATRMIMDAFGDEHELEAYTHTRDNKGDWGDAEELALVSSRVLNLVKRLG